VRTIIEGVRGMEDKYEWIQLANGDYLVKVNGEVVAVINKTAMERFDFKGEGESYK
jgi:hypothetical protein